MPSCVSHTVSTFGELHDWFSGALAFTLLVTVGLGALLAGWQVMRRDTSLRMSASMLVASIAAGCVGTWVGMLLVSTAARCGKDDRSTGRWTMTSEYVERSGFPAYFVMTSHEFESPPETERHVPLGVANVLFLTGVVYAGVAWSSTRVRSAHRSRSPRARAS